MGSSVLNTWGAEGSQGTKPRPASLDAKGLGQADAKILPRYSALPRSEDCWSLTWPESWLEPYLAMFPPSFI